MILTINGGSSSIKFALYEQVGNVEGNVGVSPGSNVEVNLLGKLENVLVGQISQIGSSEAEINFNNLKTNNKQRIALQSSDYASIVETLTSTLKKEIDFSKVSTIGHRVVHGMHHVEHTLITAELLENLKQLIPYDAEHLPNEIKLIESFARLYPEKKQYACFDTAFHKNMPRVAKILPIQRRFDKQGIHRYGFHGLSYNYLIDELKKTQGEKFNNSRIILAHLGSGASLAAVLDGKSIETSMGFTPNSGLPMSSRSGDLDPGVSWFIMKSEKLSADQFNHLASHDSGLLGVSESSADMSVLLKQEASDFRSAEAVDLFCYQVKKWIGALAAVLNGVDTLVFAGGIGEHAAPIRSRICAGLNFLGIELDEKLNSDHAAEISLASGRVKVCVMHTDEELMIARIVAELMTIK